MITTLSLIVHILIIWLLCPLPTIFLFVLHDILNKDSSKETCFGIIFGMAAGPIFLIISLFDKESQRVYILYFKKLILLLLSNVRLFKKIDKNIIIPCPKYTYKYTRFIKKPPTLKNLLISWAKSKT